MMSTTITKFIIVIFILVTYISKIFQSNTKYWKIFKNFYRFYYTGKKNKKGSQTNLKYISLFSLFTIKYNTSTKRKRKFVIYYAFSLLIDKIDFEINISNETEKINSIIEKIDSIYKDIKKNEISPNTDYLFTNLKKSNIEKTIEKIEMINNM